jgi:hypothetical protein
MAQLHFEYQQRNPYLAQTYCGLLRQETIETFPNLSFQIQRFDPDLAIAMIGHLAKTRR